MSTRQKNRLSRYLHLLRQLEKAITTGRFYQWSLRKRRLMLLRLERYYRQCQRVTQLFHEQSKKWLVAGILTAGISTLSQSYVNAQQFEPFSFGLADVGFYNTPDFVDIDGDGDLDALIGDSGGNVRYFENTGSSTSAAFASPQADPFGLTDVGFRCSPDFVDLDGDGDLDALIGERDGNLIYFENTGSSTSAAFAAAQTNPFGLSDVGYNSSPNLVDLDGDGDLDALIGERNGNLYFENTGSSTSAAFALPQTNPFGLANVGRASSPELVDIDGDGDLDALIGEFYGNLIFFENTGSSTSAALVSPQFNPFGLSDLGFTSSPELADLDGDGDLDALIGDSGGNVRYFENTGSSTSAAFASPQANPFSLSNVGPTSSPELADLDGDGDLDALIGAGSGNIIYFENTGSSTSAAFAAAQINPFGLSNVGSYSSPDLVDLDGDGDLDALIGERFGNLIYFENTGSSTSAAFASPQTNPFGLSDVSYNSSPDLVDLDGDGDLDALIGERYGNLLYFENTGSSTSAAFASPQTNPFGLSPVGFDSSPKLADLDGDGDLDVLRGQYEGNFIFQENIAPPQEIMVEGMGMDIMHMDMSPVGGDGTDFGDAAVNGGSVIRTFNIRNSGSADLTLGMNAVSLIGTHPGDFSITDQPDEVVSPGGMTTFEVTFDPTLGGLREATVEIANDDADESPFTFSIQGNGQEAEIAVEGMSMDIMNMDMSPEMADGTDFGATPVGSDPLVQTFTIRNTGDADLTLGMNALMINGMDGGDFEVTIQPAETIAPGGSTTFEITFTPTEVALRTAEVSITNDDLDESPFTFSIQGIGAVPIPTMGQWGLILLGLLSAILGVMGLRFKGSKVERQKG